MLRFPASLRTHSLLAALSLAAPSAFGQSVSTDPVGFITVAVTGGSVSSPRLSMIAPTLMHPVEWQGAIATIANTTITVAGTPWGANQFNGPNGAYFVEIASGTGAGALTDIVATAANSLTTNDSLAAFGSTGATIRIRKQVTIGSFFGVNNSAGLLAGATLSASDEVLVYDGAVAISYFYYDGSAGGLPEWRDKNSVPSANVIISPHQGVAIRRKSGGALSLNFTSTGAVKTGNTLLPVVPGLNVLATASAKPLTLATSGLWTGNPNTGLKGGTGVAAADEVSLYAGGLATVYWYYTGSQGGTPGWRDTKFQPADNVVIAPGSSVVVKRKSPGIAFNWALPSPTSF